MQNVQMYVEHKGICSYLGTVGACDSFEAASASFCGASDHPVSASAEPEVCVCVSMNIPTYVCLRINYVYTVTY
jgi:hypothetical protein